jgi:hypothetical protein
VPQPSRISRNQVVATKTTLANAVTATPRNSAAAMVTTSREHPVLRYARQVVDIPGDIIECGSWKLDSALKIGTICKDKLIYACDTFSGMPAPTEIDGHKKGDFPTTWLDILPLAEGTNVIPVPGQFKYTLPLIAQSVKYFSMVYIDCDLYESAKLAIDILWPCIVPNGILVADDYTNPACKGIRMIMDSYFGGRMQVDENGFVMVRKPA